MNKQKRYEIFSRLKQHNPKPTTELNYKTPFELLVAVEPGYGLRDLVEGLALEVNLDEIEPMMALMRQLCSAVLHLYLSAYR